MILEARGLAYRYPGAAAAAVSGVDLALRSGQLLALVGPNGSGKTTLLRLLVGALPPERGEARLLGRPVRAFERRERARSIAVVAQREEPAFPLRVREAVMLGRYPYLGPWGAPGRGDREAVERALERTDALHLASRWVATLSGGEWQRVRLARALAQEPRALVLDEPSANLDVAHEMALFELVAELVRTQDLAALVVTHHVNLAARFAGHLVVLAQGKVVASGPPAAVITPAVIEPVFGWPVEVIPWRGIPQCIPLKRSEVTS
jgi:iron complex transport system ATP-binding protein